MDLVCNDDWKGSDWMKKFFSLILALMLLLTCSSSLAAKKVKATPTPAPVEISADPQDPPALIQHMLDIAYQDWVDVNGKDQGKKNKYTTWYNNYNWGKNRWCAGFVTWCMLEAGIPQAPEKELKSSCEEGTAPEAIYHVKGSSPAKMAPGYLYMNRTTNIPQRGFIVLYGENSNKYVHVGIVYDVSLLPDGKYRLTCIEGAMKNTVRMFVYDYDAAAEKKKNIILLPEEERTQEETKIFTYKQHGKGWYVNCFLMPWVPGQTEE